jgi:tetratricopeptide (TPR) repeat protein
MRDAARYNPGTGQAALQSQLEQAIAFHQQGRLNEAEALYRSLLRGNPRHFDAVHLLGVVELQRNRLAEATELFDMAASLNPDVAELQSRRGLALMGAGRVAEALACFDKAASLEPGLAHAWANRGAAQHALGRYEDALTSYDKALALYPGSAELLTNRGHTLIELGRFEEALASLNAAIDAAPGMAAAFNNRGVAFHRMNRFDNALADFDRAIALHPSYAEAFNNRGNTLRELNRIEDALASTARSLALDPSSAEAHNSRGIALQALNRFEDALASFDRALAIKPAYVNALNNRGAALRDLDRAGEAVATFDRVLAIAPSDAEAAYNRALAKLTLGWFAQGWEDYEHRFKSPTLWNEGRADVDATLFTAAASREMLRDKRVLVVAEQGVGDEIMFAGLVSDLMQDARSVTLECDRRLEQLYTRSFAEAEIVPKQMPPLWAPGTFDVILPIGSLGRLYRNGAEAFPKRDRYLVPDDTITATWRARLSDLGRGLKVGISWRGGTNKSRRNARSIPLELWRPILDVPDLHFVSLQYGDPRDEIAEANASLATPITCFAPEDIEDFDQLAGLIASLDVVISVQTAVVHLSGAVGQQCRVMVPSAAEWRYGAQGETMPWYGSVRLHRQSVPGDWDDVIARVSADLAQLSTDKRDPA